MITWDSTYVDRYKILLQNLATKYASDTTVSYINTIASAFSRGLPDTVVTDTTNIIKEPFWLAYKYNADSLATLMNQMTDYYMNLFPNTHLWCSVDYVSFETHASGKARNYLASLYTNYGIANYPKKFGLWREDLSGCNPNIANIQSGSPWYIMQQNACRTGAQMLWNVQDGPARMNKCDIVPNTKTAVLDSAVNKGLGLGMRYLEIYGIDITDTELTKSIQHANTKLIEKAEHCNSSTKTIMTNIDSMFSIYPNPANNHLTIKTANKIGHTEKVLIFNSTGMLVKEVEINNSQPINVTALPPGLYFISLNNKQQAGIKFLKL